MLLSQLIKNMIKKFKADAGFLKANFFYSTGGLAIREFLSVN